MTSPLSVFELPAFWRGAAAARTELMNRYREETADVLRYHQAIGAHESIADALNAGKSLDAIPEFAAWQATAQHKRRSRPVPDPLLDITPRKGKA